MTIFAEPTEAEVSKLTGTFKHSAWNRFLIKREEAKHVKAQKALKKADKKAKAALKEATKLANKANKKLSKAGAGIDQQSKQHVEEQLEALDKLLAGLKVLVAQPVKAEPSEVSDEQIGVLAEQVKKIDPKSPDASASIEQLVAQVEKTKAEQRMPKTKSRVAQVAQQLVTGSPKPVNE